MNRKLICLFAASFAVAVPVASFASLQNGLIANLPFDGNYSDASGNGISGTAVGLPTFAPGIIGSAVAVSNNGEQPPKGKFNYVTLGKPAALNFGTGNSFSVSLWSKFSDWSGDPSLISNKDWNSGSNTGWVLATASDGHFQWNYREASPQTRKDYDGPPGTISDGNWHHIVTTFARGGSALSYIDGLLVNTTSLGAGGSTLDSGLATNIGQDGTGTYTDTTGGVRWGDALIDDVAIWNRVLSAGEVADIRAAGVEGFGVASLVPEPGSIGLLSLVSLVALRRRNR